MTTMKLLALVILLTYIAIVTVLFAIFRAKVLKYIFIGSFLCALILPLVFLDRKNAYSTLENRMFAAVPRLFTLNAPEEIDAYVNDRFGFKGYFVRVNTMLNTLLGGKKNGRVLIGNDGWLFYIDKDNGKQPRRLSKNKPL